MLLSLIKNQEPPKQQPIEAMPLSECLAKTYTSQEGEKKPGRSVLSHCRIVGEVARELIIRLPIWLCEKLFPPGSELAAAAHDVGKISPTFQKKIYLAINHSLQKQRTLINLNNVNPDLEKIWGYHGGVSQATAKAMNVGNYIPEILGQHHGYSPNLKALIADDEPFGGKDWQLRREELLNELKAALNCDWPQINNPLQARVLSGLTTVADWIGSSSWFDNPNKPWHTCIQQSLDHAGFIRPKIYLNLSFFDIFGFESHTAQQTLFENIMQPGVYVLEAPMGMGKTEAALYAAYQAILKYDATGIYFALPTQLTSDKLYDRMNKFLAAILMPDCPHRQALLLHGNAWLKHSDLGVDCQPGGSWFQSGKRGILAPFAAGTIDQALMAVMNVKHGFVRTFGLAGKVVILDEVHSYDAYTGTILDKLVEVLRELQCTVIILSATLTRERRQVLLAQQTITQGYPLISIASGNSLKEFAVEPPPDKIVSICILQEEEQAMEEAILRAEQGQQVLWIENTVKEAQSRYKKLSARCREINVDCGLLHSRFLKTDRMNNEKKWVELFGKEKAAIRYAQGRILIGTQVLEQSLDIDADFLITRMCPTDMLLQRLGRLWRHEQIRPHSALREAWILAPTLNAALKDAKKAFDRTAKIYSPYVLCRSLEVWEKLNSVALPSQIPSLIEATYAERPETPAMLSYQAELTQIQKKLKGLALTGLSQGGTTLPENQAATRYSEQETVEVLLFRSLRRENDQGIYLTLLSNEEIYLPKNGKVLNRSAWLDKAVLLAQNTVQVAEYLAPDSIVAKSLNCLEDYLYLGSKEQEESLLRVATVQPSGDLSGFHGGSASTTYRLFYDSEFGYQATKLVKE